MQLTSLFAEEEVWMVPSIVLLVQNSSRNVVVWEAATQVMPKSRMRTDSLVRKSSTPLVLYTGLRMSVMKVGQKHFCAAVIGEV